ncbi:unnamed protein product, partial [Urochloa humidicola]
DTLTGCDPLSQSPSVPRGLDGRRRRRRGSTCSSARGCALQLVAAPQPPPQLRPVAAATTALPARRRRRASASPIDAGTAPALPVLRTAFYPARPPRRSSPHNYDESKKN